MYFISLRNLYYYEIKIPYDTNKLPSLKFHNNNNIYL